jgi:hypothetical protein
MLDVPNGTYWTHWREFVVDELTERELIAPSDVDLFLVTDDVEAACDEIVGFYSNYDSMRYVGDRLVIRLARGPEPDAIEMLNRDFADISHAEGFEVIAPLNEEIEDDDQLDKVRVAFRFNRNHFARLRALIDALNRLP